jgi:hypothetical protein
MPASLDGVPVFPATKPDEKPPQAMQRYMNALIKNGYDAKKHGQAKLQLIEQTFIQSSAAC